MSYYRDNATVSEATMLLY